MDGPILSMSGGLKGGGGAAAPIVLRNFSVSRLFQVLNVHSSLCAFAIRPADNPHCIMPLSKFQDPPRRTGLIGWFYHCMQCCLVVG